MFAMLLRISHCRPFVLKHGYLKRMLKESLTWVGGNIESIFECLLRDTELITRRSISYLQTAILCYEPFPENFLQSETGDMNVYFVLEIL